MSSISRGNPLSAARTPAPNPRNTRSVRRPRPSGRLVRVVARNRYALPQIRNAPCASPRLHSVITNYPLWAIMKFARSSRMKLWLSFPLTVSRGIQPILRTTERRSKPGRFHSVALVKMQRSLKIPLWDGQSPQSLETGGLTGGVRLEEGIMRIKCF